MSPSAARRAFTLLELIVVIAVIALLAAMLLPALERAREAARRVQCQSHQRQIHMAAAAYGADWDQWLPGGGHLAKSPSTAYNRGDVRGFLERYLQVRDGLLDPDTAAYCPSSRLAEYGGYPAPRLVGYSLNGFGASNYRPSCGGACCTTRFYGHPRLGALETPGPAPKGPGFLPRGPKVIVMDWLYAEISAANPWHYKFATGHRPRRPEGMNVTAADGSCRWVPLERTVRIGNNVGDARVPMGYFTQRWGAGCTARDNQKWLQVQRPTPSQPSLDDASRAAARMYGYAVD